MGESSKPEKDNWHEVLYGKRQVKGDKAFWDAMRKATEQFRHGFKMREYDCTGIELKKEKADNAK